ncbi:replication protein P [Gallibacterium anatis]|uniref:replication protein P n=1 Tax=Gallibacterium anatis TaxID=750 RepID=UPI0015C68AEA|nr:replication protein P [Gallibacterium anatis]WAX72126.1 replication protein P [Gallibacterium anatis]
MKTFNNTELALKQSEGVKNTPVEGKRVEVSDHMGKFVDRLFVRLKAIFPAWKYALQDNGNGKDPDLLLAEIKTLWLEALINHHVTTAELFKRGIDEAEKSKRPHFPSVGEFIDWCTGGNKYHYLGLPTAEELKTRLEQFRPFYRAYEQEKFNFQSDAEYWLLTSIAYESLSNACNKEQEFKLIQRKLDKMAEKLASGEPLPKRVITLSEESVVKPYNPQAVARFFSRPNCSFRRRRND